MQQHSLVRRSSVSMDIRDTCSATAETNTLSKGYAMWRYLKGTISISMNCDPLSTSVIGMEWNRTSSVESSAFVWSSFRKFA